MSFSVQRRRRLRRSFRISRIVFLPLLLIFSGQPISPIEVDGPSSMEGRSQKQGCHSSLAVEEKEEKKREIFDVCLDRQRQTKTCYDMLHGSLIIKD